MTIVLDQQAKLGSHQASLNKFFDLFEFWISRNKLLPLLAYKSNINHAALHLLNPLPSLFHVTTIYPFRSFVDSFDLLIRNVQLRMIKTNGRLVFFTFH